MVQKHTKKIVLTGLLALLFVLSACGTASKAGSPSPSQTLQNSATAMSKLNEVHVDLQSTVNVQSSGSSTNGITFNVTGQADAASPNQFSLHLNLAQNPLFAIISTGNAVYLQKGNQQWYSIDSSKLSDGSQKSLSQGLPASMGQVLTILQNATLTDKGLATVNGQQLDHITATLDPNSLQMLTTQLNGMLPPDQQNEQNQLKQGTMDLWIDPATSYIHQAKLNATAQVDLNSLSSITGQHTGGSQVVPVVLNAQLNFSKFNQPVSIQAPSNSVPYPQQ
jgi:outer membrane lipoprotein-sorting protein